MKSFVYLLLLSLLCGKPSFAAWDEGKDPWTSKGQEFSDWTTPLKPRKREIWERLAADEVPPPESSSLDLLLAEDLLWIYQNTLSGNTGSQCPHYPSCSRYSRIAIDDYGLALGIIMTAERLERCHDDANDKGQYAWKEIDGKTLIWDPPRLDAWWVGSNP
jgi:putative component of membrane protein insertase Oxa1/YidC/SpoIIIJ protein YidD